MNSTENLKASMGFIQATAGTDGRLCHLAQQARQEICLVKSLVISDEDL